MINRKKLSQIKCIVAEVDGVLTDGKTWFNQNGVKQRKFSVRDSIAIRRLLRSGYAFAVVASDFDQEIVAHFEQLGVKNFVSVEYGKINLTSFLSAHQLTPSDCAFVHVGSYQHDFDFGFSVSVPNAPGQIRTSVQHVTGCEGGEGAISEFAQLILDHGSYSSITTARKAANL